MNKQPKHFIIPTVRFPEFKNKEEWKVGLIKDLFDLNENSERSTSFDGDKIITVRLHALGVVKNERTSTLTGGASYFKRKAGQFIFSKIDLLSGAFGLVPNSLDGFYSSADVPAFSFKRKESSTFFFGWMVANYKHLTLERTGTSSTLKRVSKDGFLNLPIALPDPEEQQKIADCLSSVDDLVTAENQKLDTLKAHKKGLMQQLFPGEGETVPKLRFKEFKNSAEWLCATLGDVASVSSGGTPSRAIAEYWNGSIPWISTTLIDFNIINEANEFITELGLENSSTKFFPKGTILMAMYGQGKTRGKVAILGIASTINQACGAITLNEGMNTNFVFQNLAGRYDEIRAISNQGGQENLSGELIKGIPLSHPETKSGEQQKIADCLSSLDDLISAQSEKVDLIKAHKKGLIQQLFPVINES